MRRHLDNPLGVTLTAMWVLTGILLMLAIAWDDPMVRLSCAIAALIAVGTHAFVLGPSERRTRIQINRITSVLGEFPGSRPLGQLGSDGLGEIADRIQTIRDDLDRERRMRVAMEQAAGTLLDAIPSPVLLVDVAGQVLHCNGAAAKLVGRAPHMVPGRMLEEVLPRAEVLALHQAAVRGESAQARARIETQGGIATFEVAAIPTNAGSLGHHIQPSSLRGAHASPANALHSDSHPPTRHSAASRIAVMLSFSDVTELATAVELKTDFVANASHELRTPVASISAALDSLANPNRPDEAVQTRVVDLARNNLVRLQELIRDLLDLARLESPNVSVRVSTIAVDALRDRMQSRYGDLLASRGVGLEFEIEPGLDRLECDAGLLDLVLSNLIDNASKFAFEHTSVRVLIERGASADPDTNPGTNVGTNPGTNGRADLSLRVIDRGIGIPLNQQQRIFERFYQIDEARSGNSKRRGTGLGLAIVKHAIRTLGGQITVQSVWQEGTTMSVTIPGVVSGAVNVNGGLNNGATSGEPDQGGAVESDASATTKPA
jgi:two-component system phosphate regulon sensor histidine kinase PhoR